MRIVSHTILSLSIIASAAAAISYAAHAASGFSKVELMQELPIGGAQKLLGWSDGNAFFARKDGAVSVLDKTGKELITLQAKDRKGESILKHPEAIAVADGVVYVVDSETNLVAMFTLQGAYKGSFGAKERSFFSKSDSLSSPRDIAIHEGIVYVADTGNGKIQLFGINGVFLSALEIDSNPENSNTGEKKLPYRLVEPVRIGIDNIGQIYALDADDSLIKIYKPNGAFVRQLRMDGKAQSFTMTHDGIFVADRDSFAISKYDFNDKPVYSFGSKGSGRAQFKNIAGIATDQDRMVMVGDNEKGIADVFTVEAAARVEPLMKLPTRTSVRAEKTVPASINKIAFDGKNTIYGIDPEHTRIVRVVDGTVAGDIKVPGFAPWSVAVDKTGALWALDKKKAKLSKLDASGKVLLSIGTPGSRKGEFDDPEDFAISSTGTIFIADTGNHRVQVYSSDGVFLKEINNDSGGSMDEPTALALDPQDGLYVLDKGRSVVGAFSAKGEPRAVLGAREGISKLEKPTGLMATYDEVFVLDENQVKVFEHKGRYIRSFASKGSGMGELDQPMSIAATGAATFSIAELGNKRIQSFTSLYKPTAPQQLSAQGAVHSIDLNWDGAALPYVKQYRIFRSQNDNSGFVQIATSDTNRYIDKGVTVDQQYFYRVSGLTPYGYAGVKSAAAAGTPLRYTPPALGEIQLEPTPWQMKMRWQAADQQYFNSYRIYQKDGEAFTRVGEVKTPEFIKTSLLSDTKYTFYVSVSSTDGTESEKTPVTGATLQFIGAPLEIEVVNLQDIFSNTYKLYEQNGIGRVKITNNTNKVIEKINVSFSLNNIVDFPTEGKIEKLQPGQGEEITLRAVFNNNILTITEDSSVQAQIEASYFVDGKKAVFSKNPTLTVYDKHRMTWDEHDRFASFVTPKDVPIMNFVRSIAIEYNDTKENAQLGALVFNAMGTIGFTYVQNPSDPYQISIKKTEKTAKTDTVDYVQYPRETLERKSGDCVDLVGFYASALESIGIPTLMVEVPDHLLMMFSTGINADTDKFTMDDLYVIHEGKLWIPVEVTLVGKSFIKAWESGATNYYKWKDKGLALLDIHESWNTYKPATLPTSLLKPVEVTAKAMEKKFPGDFLSMLKISSQTKTHRYLKAIEKKPTDVDAHLQIGIILAKMGDREEAMKYFDKVLVLEPKNPAALNNRGNIFMIAEKYAEAQKAYLAATAVAADDANVWVNLSKAYKMQNQTKKAKESFIKAYQLDPSVRVNHRAMALELLNSL